MASGGLFRSLRVRNFRLYASGQAISLTGTWMQRVAQDWLVLDLSHNSGTALGIVLALQFGPTLVFSMLGGILADRYDKRRVLMVTQAAMAALAVALGLLDLSGSAQLWHVYVLAGLMGVVSAIDVPVRQSFAVEMVGGDGLTNALSLNAATFNSARIVGPALAGVLITAVGTGWLFLANAVMTLGVITGLLLMRASELFRSPPVGRSPGQLREGLRYVRGRPDLILPMLLIFVIGTFGLNFPVTLALMAREEFGRGATEYGLLTTMVAVGSLAGALLSGRRTGPPRQRLLLISALGFGLIETAVGLMPTYVLLAVALIPMGWITLTTTIAANSTVQLSVEPTMRGRVMALYLICFMGGTPLGGPLIGVASDLFGPRAGLVGGGLVCAVAAVLLGLLFSRMRGLRLREQVGALPHPHLAGHLHLHLRRADTDPEAEPARAA